MSTNRTPNFNLCQWEATDPVLRADFNQDNAKIDTALSSQAAALAEKPWKSVIYDRSNASTALSSEQFTSLVYVNWAAHEIVCLHVFYKEAENYSSNIVSISLGNIKVADINVQDFMIILFPLRDPTRNVQGLLLCSTPKVFYLEETFIDLYGLILKVSAQTSRPGNCFFGLG